MTQDIRFGPAGIGGAKEAVQSLEKFNKLGFRAAEVEFTYKVYIKKEDALEIAQAAKKLDIRLSIHAPYYINLNSEWPDKVKRSVKRILDCCEMADYLGAKYVVFHSAFYGLSKKKTSEEVYETVKQKILEMQEVIHKNKWGVTLAPEAMGKKSQFGSVDELIKLRKETGCFFCIDFAHLEARTGKAEYTEILEKLKANGITELQCHFSGIEYGEQGEKRHVVTPNNKLKELLLAFKKTGLSAVIINESPDPLGDSRKGMDIWKKQ
ncbi:MAG: TIM barrel protein [Candidatus Pacearchaeota archaeon]|nr:TIM barrel protein [Candidatus Pacearchaeota archaeon]